MYTTLLYKNYFVGLCSCTHEYAGDDCSQQTYLPPANISLPTAGLCGTCTRACQRTNIYGYFPSNDVWCNKTHFQAREIFFG